MTVIENFELKNKVKHPQFGEGEVIEVQGSGDHQKVRVDFKETVGVKRLAVRLARLKKLNERPLLAPSEDGGETPAEPVAEPLAASARAKTRTVAAADADEDDEDVDLDDDADADDEDDEEV